LLSCGQLGVLHGVSRREEEGKKREEGKKKNLARGHGSTEVRQRKVSHGGTGEKESLARGTGRKRREKRENKILKKGSLCHLFFFLPSSLFFFPVPLCPCERYS